MKINTGITIWLVLVIVIVIAVGLSLSYFVSEHFKETILKRTVDVNANFITVQANQHLKAEDFVPTDFDKKDKIFSAFFHEVDTAEIVRIKIWSPDETVIYSDDKQIVGKSFTDNDELKEALHGEVVSEISDLQNTENVSERGEFGQLIEIYIPIKSSSNNVVGVIETYASMNSVNQYIQDEDTIVFLISAMGGGTVGMIAFVSFIKLRKNVIRPIMLIHQQAKKIQAGHLDIKSESSGYEEIKKLGDEITIMAGRLKEQKEHLVKTERLSAIGELAARLAHDLRNPLTVIRSSLFFIQHKYGAQTEIMKDFEKINRSIFRMSHQIDNVLDFVATRPLQTKTISINEVLKSSIAKASIPDTVRVNLPTNDVVINADPVNLEVAFENLLINARQSMNDSGTIDIRTMQEQDFTKIEVEDSGTGIPNEILPRIFDPLFTTKQEGTGLGLASCKNIIEQHGGVISVKSEVGKGTIFTITLPINKIQKTIDVVTSSKTVKTL